MDNLLGSPIFVDYFNRKFKDSKEDTMVVSPDVGSVARARAFAQKLNMPLPVGPGGGDQVGHQLGGDGVPGLGLPVLAGVAGGRDDGGNPFKEGWAEENRKKKGKK